MTIGKFALALLALIASALLSAAPSGAASPQPTIYYFSAEGCDYCANGLAFLKRWKTADEGIKIREFDIVANSDDATAFVRIVQAIGLADPRVPMTIVGHHVFIGYEGDDSTGEEIKLAVEQCRAKECADVVRGLLAVGAESVKAPGGWILHQRFAKAAISK